MYLQNAHPAIENSSQDIAPWRLYYRTLFRERITDWDVFRETINKGLRYRDSFDW